MKVLIKTLAVALCVCASGCKQEKQVIDRSLADEMFHRICRLTEEYTDRLESAPDSADWAELTVEFEDRLDKISFSYPPDTDLLLTEGQNDTIHHLMQEYVKMREERIYGLLHPEPELDSLAEADSVSADESPSDVTSR